MGKTNRQKRKHRKAILKIVLSGQKDTRRREGLRLAREQKHGK